MGKWHVEGFSLVEFMVVLCVLVVGLGLGAPMFSQTMANHRMSSTVNDLVQSLHGARSEALKRGQAVAVCALAPGNEPACAPEGSFADGWLVFVDRNDDGIKGGPGEVVLQQRPAGGGSLRVSSLPTDAVVTFDRLGRVRLADGAPAFDLQFCDDRGDRDTGRGVAAGRWLRLHPTGRLELHRERDLLESAANPLGGCGA